MLYQIDDRGSLKAVTKIPHQREYNTWRNRLSSDDYQAICTELNKRINSGDIHTAGWIPGSDWTNTVFEPIFLACNQNKEASGLFFGLLVYDVMMQRPERWSYGRYELNSIPIKSLTYFRI